MKIKALADVRPVAVDDADSVIRSFHLKLSNDNKKNSAEA
jgi:homocitrate synthase